ncbi:hypothetical protein STENM223S_07644 [Streptomyces tendae]
MAVAPSSERCQRRRADHPVPALLRRDDAEQHRRAARDLADARLAAAERLLRPAAQRRSSPTGSTSVRRRVGRISPAGARPGAVWGRGGRGGPPAPHGSRGAGSRLAPDRGSISATLRSLTFVCWENLSENGPSLVRRHPAQGDDDTDRLVHHGVGGDGLLELVDLLLEFEDPVRFVAGSARYSWHLLHRATGSLGRRRGRFRPDAEVEETAAAAAGGAGSGNASAMNDHPTSAPVRRRSSPRTPCPALPAG